MTKAEIISDIAQNTGQTKSVVEQVVDDFVGLVNDQIKDGERVSIPRLGVFSLKYKPARQGRNPSNGETINIAAKNVVHFKAAKVFNEYIN